MDIEITKREVILSIVIVSIMLILGFGISDKINDHLMDKYQEYNTAMKIDNNPELFAYGMKTNVGNAFIYGTISAEDTVSHPNIEGEYGYINRVKERYTQHSRVVTTTTVVNGRSHTRTHTETYWTWDTIDSESIHSNKVRFMNKVFDYEVLPFFPTYYKETQSDGYHLRSKYYTSDTTHTGTLYALLSDGTIANTEFHHNMTISESIKDKESKIEIYLFWVVWIILTGACVFGFYALDNRWLK